MLRRSARHLTGIRCVAMLQPTEYRMLIYLCYSHTCYSLGYFYRLTLEIKKAARTIKNTIARTVDVLNHKIFPESQKERWICSVDGAFYYYKITVMGQELRSCGFESQPDICNMKASRTCQYNASGTQFSLVLYKKESVKAQIISPKARKERRICSVVLAFYYYKITGLRI